MSFAQLIKLSWFLKYGLLALVGGLAVVAWAFYSDNNIPERAQLEKIEGTVTGGKKVTTKRRRSGESVRFELAVQTKDNTARTITIPESHISEATITRTLGQPSVFEVDGESDVYVITTGGREILTYAQSVAKRHDQNSGLEYMGGAVAGIGLLGAGLGYLLAKRKEKKLIAEWEAEQAAHRAAAVEQVRREQAQAATPQPPA